MDVFAGPWRVYSASKSAAEVSPACEALSGCVDWHHHNQRNPIEPLRSRPVDVTFESRDA